MIWHKAPVWQNLPHRTINTLSVCRCEPLAHSHQLYTHFKRWSHDNKQYTHADWTERPRVPINQTHGDVLPFCPSSVCMCVCACLTRIIACYYLCNPVPILLTLLLGVTSGTLRVYYATHEEVLEITAVTSSKCVYVCIKKAQKICAHPSPLSSSASPVVILLSS